MMHNDLFFIGLVAQISSGGGGVTCHKEDEAQRGDLSVPDFSSSVWAHVQAL